MKKLVRLAILLGFKKDDVREIIINSIIYKDNFLMDQFTKNIISFGDNVLDPSTGFTALHYAAQYDNLEALQLYLQIYSDTNIDCLTVYGESPLFLAKTTRIVSFLMSIGANINIVNLEGSTALEVSLNQGREDIVNYLLEENDRREREEKRLKSSPLKKNTTIQPNPPIILQPPISQPPLIIQPQETNPIDKEEQLKKLEKKRIRKNGERTSKYK